MKKSPLFKALTVIDNQYGRFIDTLKTNARTYLKRGLIVILLFIIAACLPLYTLMTNINPEQNILSTVMTIIVAGTILYFETLEYQKYNVIGNTNFQWKYWYLIGGSFILIGISNIVASNISQLIDHQVTSKNQLVIQLAVSNHQQFILWGLIFVIITPIIEETFYRGIVLNLFYHVMRFRYALPLSAVFFTLNHDFSNLWFFSVYFLIGLLTGYLYFKTKSIWTAMVLHGLNNAASYAILLTTILTQRK